MSIMGHFDQTRGRLRIVSAGPLNQYQVFVDGVEINGPLGSDVLNSLARGEWAKYVYMQNLFNEYRGKLPARLTVDEFLSLMREFGPVPECVPPTLPPQSPPSAAA